MWPLLHAYLGGDKNVTTAHEPGRGPLLLSRRQEKRLERPAGCQRIEMFGPAPFRGWPGRARRAEGGHRLVLVLDQPGQVAEAGGGEGDYLPLECRTAAPYSDL